MDAVEYFKEKARMAQNCGVDCKSCALPNYENGANSSCKNFEYENPERAVEIVENWSKAHPQKTQADLFFERYPNAERRGNGMPYPRPCEIGLVSHKKCDDNKLCDDCRKKYWLAPGEG